MLLKMSFPFPGRGFHTPARTSQHPLAISHLFNTKGVISPRNIYASLFSISCRFLFPFLAPSDTFLNPAPTPSRQCHTPHPRAPFTFPRSHVPSSLARPYFSRHRLTFTPRDYFFLSPPFFPLSIRLPSKHATPSLCST